MKKIIVFFIILFISIFKVEATSKFILGEKLPMYIKAHNSNDVYTSSPYLLTRDDEKFVYCINPFQIMSTSKYYTEYNYNHSKFNLTDEQLDRMNLIAYYGYEYKNHTDIKWYGITQFVIWKQLDLTDIYFSDSNYNKINKYDSEIKELENLVYNYYKLPSFANSTLEYSSNQTYKVIDTNNVLQNYELVNSNIDIFIKDNEITINTKEDGIYTIEFIKRSPVDRQYKLYGLDGSQSLLYPGKINDIKFSLTIEVNSGDIKINKLDSEGKNRLETTLEGAIYGIYSNEELITTIETNNEGIAYIDNLPLGNYYVKEISPSTGYLLDNNIYNVSITKENKNIIITSYEKVIKGNLVINKYYGEKNNYKLEDGAEFEIYDSSKTLVDILKTENGVATINLPYGSYFITQTKTKEGYKAIENFSVSIKEEKNYEFNLYDEIIKGNLVINKYYGEENNYKLEDGAEFEIYDSSKTLVDILKTENGVTTINLPYDNYFVTQIKGKEGYSFVENFNIFISEEKDYEFNLYDDKILIVEVPDTGIYIKRYNTISLIFIILGSLVLILNRFIKKTTID